MTTYMGFPNIGPLVPDEDYDIDAVLTVLNEARKTKANVVKFVPEIKKGDAWVSIKTGYSEKADENKKCWRKPTTTSPIVSQVQVQRLYNKLREAYGLPSLDAHPELIHKMKRWLDDEYRGVRYGIDMRDIDKALVKFKQMMLDEGNLRERLTDCEIEKLATKIAEQLREKS